jgi:succinyl-diaminopimelate desuccinylase
MSDRNRQQIADFLQRQQEMVVELQRRLVSIPALGPENEGEGEERKASYLRDWLRSLGITDIRDYPAEDSRVPTGQRPNVAAVVPGKDTARTLWIVSHMDVVPAGDTSLWHTDPFQLHRDGDLLFGRGTEDNHHGMVASLLCAAAHMETGCAPATNLGLLFVADEETGNRYGLEHLVRNHRDIFAPDDAFLVPDFGTPDSSLVEVSEKSLLWLRISVNGRQCHASTPDKGVNSLLAASGLILKLRSLYAIYDAADELFEPPHSTFEATKKEANVPNVNTIPGRDVFYLDCRILPRYEVREVLDSVEAMQNEASREHGAEIESEIVHRESAPATDPEHPFIKRLIRTLQEVSGVRARPQGIGGGTVAAYVRKEGFPAAVWATLQGKAHQPNEHTSIGNIIRDAQVMSGLLT